MGALLGMTGRQLLPRLAISVLCLFVVFVAWPAEAKAELPFGRGLLWKVETPGAAPSYLFGTMHSSDPEILALPEEVSQALTDANSVTVELVMDESVQHKLGRAMVLNDGRTLDQILGPDEFDAAAEVAALYGLPADRLRIMKPWAAMTIFSIAPEEFARNMTGAIPLDQMLQSDAVRRGKPVFGLESVEEQIAVFAEIPEEDQVELLGIAVKDHGMVGQWFHKVKQAYLDRDIGALYELMKEQAAGTDPELVREFEERLIQARNLRMAGRMTDILDAGNAFVAIGALHLPGDQGVLRLLEQDGRKVSRIY